MKKKNTEEQYDLVFQECFTLFEKKFDDYGASWRVMRPTALTDQIFIKAQRIRSIQENKGKQCVEDSIRGEFVAIVNYGIMALVQLEVGYSLALDDDKNKLLDWYSEYRTKAKTLMLSKNHDYGEAWRSMRISSLADIILQKVYRTKQIENNNGSVSVSEGIDANYLDMVNYALFALIRIDEGAETYI